MNDVEVFVDRIKLRELSLRAVAAERSVLKRLRGEPVRGLTGARIDRALKEAGLEPGTLVKAQEPGQ